MCGWHEAAGKVWSLGFLFGGEKVDGPQGLG